nr:MAG TPA: hypothetical protein [Caudoviricetes sp.]
MGLFASQKASLHSEHLTRTLSSPSEDICRVCGYLREPWMIRETIS